MIDEKTVGFLWDLSPNKICGLFIQMSPITLSVTASFFSLKKPGGQVVEETQVLGLCLKQEWSPR